MSQLEEVEFGVHFDEVIGEEGWEREGEGFEDLAMGGAAEERRVCRYGGFEEGGEGIGAQKWHGLRWLRQIGRAHV